MALLPAATPGTSVATQAKPEAVAKTIPYAQQALASNPHAALINPALIRTVAAILDKTPELILPSLVAAYKSTTGAFYNHFNREHSPHSNFLTLSFVIEGTDESLNTFRTQEAPKLGTFLTAASAAYADTPYTFTIALTHRIPRSPNEPYRPSPTETYTVIDNADLATRTRSGHPTTGYLTLQNALEEAFTP